MRGHKRDREEGEPEFDNCQSPLKRHDHHIDPLGSGGLPVPLHEDLVKQLDQARLERKQHDAKIQALNDQPNLVALRSEQVSIQQRSAQLREDLNKQAINKSQMEQHRQVLFKPVDPSKIRVRYRKRESKEKAALEELGKRRNVQKDTQAAVAERMEQPGASEAKSQEDQVRQAFELSELEKKRTNGVDWTAQDQAQYDRLTLLVDLHKVR